MNNVKRFADFCYYVCADNADWNPTHNYHKLTDGCKLANGIGIVVLLSVFLCAYAIVGPGVSASMNETTDSIQSKLHP